jgi:hypothetical protein
MFDPWTASLEEAQREQESSRHDGPDAPIFQWKAARDIEGQKDLIESGDGFAILACVRKLMTHGLVAPAWLAYAFNKRYDAVLNCRANSWDDQNAFGRPYPKGKHLNALRKSRTIRFQIFNSVNQILASEPSTPIDSELFARAGRMAKPPVGKTEAERLYREAKRILNP